MKRCNCHNCLVIVILIILGITSPCSILADIEQERLDSLAITEAEDFVIASLLVATPSDVLYSSVGHACLRLQCPTYDLDNIFSYESEDVRQKILHFFAGKLRMGMAAIPTKDYLAMYAAEGRGVSEYLLNLPVSVKKRLWEYLDNKVAEGMNLPYDYLHRGCAIACVHSLEGALYPDTISYAKWSDKYIKGTRRTLLVDRLEEYPWNRFFVQTIMGTEIDESCQSQEKLVIPIDLVDVWQRSTINGTPLLSKNVNVLVRKADVPQRSSFVTPIGISIILLIISLVSLKWLTNVIAIFHLILQSTLGLLLTYFVCFSDLVGTNFSWLLIPFNLLPLVFWRWRRLWVLPYAFILGLWCLLLSIDECHRVDAAHIIWVLSIVINYLGISINLQRNRV